MDKPIVAKKGPYELTLGRVVTGAVPVEDRSSSRSVMALIQRRHLHRLSLCWVKNARYVVWL